MADGEQRQRFYILDTRQIVGNCALWWAVDAHGYTCDLAQAWLVDEAEAKKIAASRGTDVAVPEEMAKRHAFTHVRLDSLRNDLDVRGVQTATKKARR